MGGPRARGTGQAAVRYALALVLVGSTAVHAAEDAQRELDEVLISINALDAWLDEAGGHIAKGHKEVAAADRGIADASKRIRELDARIEQGGVTLVELRDERQRLADLRRKHADRVAGHLRDAWRFADRDPVRALLNLEDPRAYDRMIRYHAAFARARARLVDELRDTVTSLARNQGDLDREQRALEASRESARESRAALIDDRGNRRSAIADLNAELATRSKERERLASDRKRLESLIAELRRAAKVSRASFDETAREGELPWPVQGRVVRRFGQSRAGGRMRWQGITLEAPEGSEVTAVAPGRVVFSDWLRGFGLLAIVDHGDDWMSLYGFVDAIYKRRGDRVELGEVIATVGQSGGQAEVGLYFEMRHDGEPKDPLMWLKARAGGSRAAR